VLRLVAHAPDLAVRDVPDRPVDGTQARRPQAHDLDDPGGLADVDRVADAELVLNQDEDARQEVLDQALRAEADRHPDDARAGEQRTEVDAELIEHHEAGDHPDDEARDAAQHGCERLDPHGRPGRQIAGVEKRRRSAAARGAEPLTEPARTEFAQPPADGPSRKPVDDRRADNDPEDRKRLANEKINRLCQVHSGLTIES
jgi:hypothetical protein